MLCLRSGLRLWDHPRTLGGEQHATARRLHVIPGLSLWGNRRSVGIRFREHWDYPHVGGEQVMSSCARAHLPGSSSHAWGTVYARTHREAPRWIIPRCGEQVAFGVLHVLASGLSPCVRGTGALWRRLAERRWIIPIYVGNRTRTRCSVWLGPDYPHMCREQRKRPISPYLP